MIKLGGMISQNTFKRENQSKNTLNEGNLSTINKLYSSGAPELIKIENDINSLKDEYSKKSKIYNKGIQKEVSSIMSEFKSEFKKLNINADITPMPAGSTDIHIDWQSPQGHQVRSRVVLAKTDYWPNGPLIRYSISSKYINIELKPNMAISDIVNIMSKL